MDNEAVVIESLDSLTECAMDDKYEEAFTNEATRELLDIRSVNPQCLAANQQTKTAD